MTRASRSALVASALAVAACAAPAGPAPLGNVVVYVDTDAPVPKLVARLRVDLFTDVGEWFASRDVDASDPAAWPISFGVYLPDGSPRGQVIVRLRAYPEGALQDYDGYAYWTRPSDDSPTTVPAPATPAQPFPRLVDADGADVTPAIEPARSLAIDRLVAIPLAQGAVGTVNVLLEGACFGTMADMRDFTALQTCVATEGRVVPVTPESVDAHDAPAATSRQGAYEAPYAAACTGSPRPATVTPAGIALHDDDLCVQGGAFVFGTRDGAIGDASDDAPPRVALVPSFYMDRYEFTVGRYRDALRRGLAPQGLIANDQLLTDNVDQTSCTWSDEPMGREDMPLNCILPDQAAAICRFFSGMLPLEVEWEYAATISGGRTARTSYPWGSPTGAAPACTDVVYGRGPLVDATTCLSFGGGPAAVTVADHPGGDRSYGLGIVDLAGNVAELARDTFASMQSDCWQAAPLELPSCRPDTDGHDTMRGGAWLNTADALVAASRDFIISYDPSAGFRCVRPGGSGP